MSTPVLSPKAFLERFWSYNDAPDNSFHMMSVKEMEAWTDIAWDPDGEFPTTEDLYFTPTTFSEPRRLGKCAVGKSPWLYADLDEVDPRYLDIRPQVAWETSPGRYQCAWRLDTPLGIRAQERLNKAMTYHTKADKGGWSWTKALRVPGSTSLKRDEPVPVVLLWVDWDTTLPVEDVRRTVKAALPPLDVAAGPIDLPKATAREIRREHWKAMSPRLRKLLRARTVYVGDDRSARLWEVEGLCLEAGLSPGETVRVAQACVYNKYKGQRRELRKLMEEVGRQVELKKQRDAERAEEESIPDVVFGMHMEPESNSRSFFAKAELDLLGPMEKPDYVIRNVVARGQVLILSADSGVGKSWIGLDLVRACIMREKWLDRPVIGRKVLYVDEENGLRILNGRLRGLMLAGNAQDQRLQNLVSRNLHLCSRNGVSIGDAEQQEELENIIRDLSPSLLIIDTAMSATNVGEVNDNTAVVDLMKRLRYLAEKYHLAVILMHHDRKPQGEDAEPNQKGTSMMGARQWQGQADAHISLTPYGQSDRDMQSGNRGLITEVVMHCAKVRDDVPFRDELIRISSIKDPSGRIKKASVKSMGPPPPKPVQVVDRIQATADVVDLNPTGKGDRDWGTGTLNRLIPGEVISLKDAAEQNNVHPNALRSRVNRSKSFTMDRVAGRAVIRRV